MSAGSIPSRTRVRVCVALRTKGLIRRTRTPGTHTRVGAASLSVRTAHSTNLCGYSVGRPRSPPSPLDPTHRRVCLRGCEKEGEHNKAPGAETAKPPSVGAVPALRTHTHIHTRTNVNLTAVLLMDRCSRWHGEREKGVPHSLVFSDVALVGRTRWRRPSMSLPAG